MGTETDMGNRILELEREFFGDDEVEVEGEEEPAGREYDHSDSSSNFDSDSEVNVKKSRQSTLVSPTPTPTKVRVMFSLSGEAYDAYEHIVEAAIRSGGGVDAADAIVDKALVDAWKRMSEPVPKAGMWPGSPEARAAEWKEKRLAPKVRRCNTCDTTDPDRFYSYFYNICKECYKKRQYDRKAARRRSAGMRVKDGGEVKSKVVKRPSNPWLAPRPRPTRYTGMELVERCAAEIRAAGSSGMFQRELRDKVGLDRYTCRLVVKELVDSGRVERTGEQSMTGSPRLVWKALNNQPPRDVQPVTPVRIGEQKGRLQARRTPRRPWYKSGP